MVHPAHRPGGSLITAFTAVFQRKRNVAQTRLNVGRCTGSFEGQQQPGGIQGHGHAAAVSQSRRKGFHEVFSCV
jgi:hypothetical protein